MFMIPAPPEIPVSWPTCVVRFDDSSLATLDRTLLRKARKQVRRLTGLRFVVDSGTVNKIDIEYSREPNFAIAQAGVQSLDGKIFYAGITLFPQYHEVGVPRKVLIHELLHAVGVRHSENPASLMYYSLRRGQKVDSELRRAVRSSYRHCLQSDRGRR